VEEFVEGAFSDYGEYGEIPHEVFALRVLRCLGMEDFSRQQKHSIDIQTSFSVGVHAMLSYTHLFPAYIESLNNTLKHFMDIQIPVPGREGWQNEVGRQ
jgi:hypothetical protein